MTRPLEKLIMASAKRFHLSEEARAALVTTAAKKCILGLFPVKAPKEDELHITYTRETLYIRTRNSGLAASLQLQRLAILHHTRKENPQIPLRAIIVLGSKK